MPLKFCDKSLLTSMFLINLVPTKVLNLESPGEKLIHIKPNYDSIRIFGSACWQNLCRYNKHKLDFHSKQCVFWDIVHFIRGSSVWMCPLGVSIYLVILYVMKIFFPFNQFILMLVLVLIRNCYPPIIKISSHTSTTDTTTKKAYSGVPK